MKKILLTILIMLTSYTTYSMHVPAPHIPTLQVALTTTFARHPGAPAVIQRHQDDAAKAVLYYTSNVKLQELRDVYNTPHNINFRKRQAINTINQITLRELGQHGLDAAIFHENDADKTGIANNATNQDKENIAQAALFFATPADIQAAIDSQKRWFIIKTTSGALGIATIRTLINHSIHTEKWNTPHLSFYSKRIKPLLQICHKHATLEEMLGAAVVTGGLYAAHQLGGLQNIWNNRRAIIHAPIDLGIRMCQNPRDTARVLAWPAILLCLNWLIRGDKSLISHCSNKGLKGIIPATFEQLWATGSGIFNMMTPEAPQQKEPKKTIFSTSTQTNSQQPGLWQQFCDVWETHSP